MKEYKDIDKKDVGKKNGDGGSEREGEKEKEFWQGKNDYKSDLEYERKKKEEASRKTASEARSWKSTSSLASYVSWKICESFST